MLLLCESCDLHSVLLKYLCFEIFDISSTLWLLSVYLMKGSYVEFCISISMKTLVCLFCSAWMHLVRWEMMLWTIIFTWKAQMKRASMSRPVWSSVQMSCSLWFLLLCSSIRFNPAVSELGECNLCILAASVFMLFCLSCKCFIRMHNFTKGLPKHCAAPRVA